jgi:hypothetical protein
MHLDNKLDFRSAGSVEQTQDWIDPTVGGELTIGLTKNLAIWMHGDVGGFDTASQFTWCATGVLAWRFHIGSLESSVFAGYKAIGDDYSKGSGNDKFTWDTIMHGPVIGMTITF